LTSGPKSSNSEERRSSVNIDYYSYYFIVYNKGLLAVVQRMLNMMNEEDAFWMLIGIVKGFNHLYTFEHKDPLDESQLAHFSPFLTRRIGLKNEMAILNCIIKIHNPLVYDKLKSLGMPIEWYFYD
jgi:hypothetical protein